MSDFLVFARGQRLYSPYSGDASVVVLGGPSLIGRGLYYTVIPTIDGVIDLASGQRMVKQGESCVVRGNELEAFKVGEKWSEKDIQYFHRYYPDTRYQEVIEQECPSCGIDEMIFYSEDYMCAWCREVLEDGL